ncbi:MAG: type II restriction endonuclease, partial [Candidatus Aenigmatarchaeota archaeon]
KEKTINDVKSMALYLFDESLTKYIVSILNSTFFSNYQFIFVNNTVSIQINDVRQLPIIIPTPEQLKEFEAIFNRAVQIQKQKFAGKLSEQEAEAKLDEIQRKLDERVLSLYKLKG